MGTNIRDLSLPAEFNTSWYQHYQALDEAARRGAYDSFHLDEFAGTDEQKLGLAITAQQGATARNMPPIILPNRPMTFTSPRNWYSGQKIIGPFKQGQTNPELSNGAYVGPEISFGGTIGNGASSWWNNNASIGSLYDVHMADFSMQGSQGSATHQFADCAVGTMYACNFDAISSNFMRAMYGDGATSRKFLATQVSWTGNNTWNNLWRCAWFVGGSDVLFAPDMCNIGVSSSAAQTAPNTTTYFLMADSLEADFGGKIYVSTMNGWRGLLISGSSNINLYGGVYEGFKPTRQNGLLSGPGPGSQVKITGGSVMMFGTKIGQGLDNPAAGEAGLLEVNGGEVSMFGVEFYGANLSTVNSINHTAGRLSAYGITKRPGAGGQGPGARPRIASVVPVRSGTNTTVGGVFVPPQWDADEGSTSMYCPDASLAA